MTNSRNEDISRNEEEMKGNREMKLKTLLLMLLLNGSGEKEEVNNEIIEMKIL